jgi:hypothetical protein
MLTASVAFASQVAGGVLLRLLDRGLALVLGLQVAVVHVEMLDHVVGDALDALSDATHELGGAKMIGGERVGLRVHASHGDDRGQGDDEQAEPQRAEGDAEPGRERQIAQQFHSGTPKGFDNTSAPASARRRSP